MVDRAARFGPKAHLLTVLVPVLLGLIAVGAFTWSVDPYALRGYGGEPGFNDQKAPAYQQDRLHKAHALVRQQPEVVLLGTSRVGMGLDPQHPAFDGRRAYNLGLTGANAYELQRTYQHAQAVSDVHEVVLGVDFFMFDAAGRPPATFNEARLRVYESGTINLESFYVDYPPALWSQDALEASLRVIQHSRVMAGMAEGPEVMHRPAPRFRDGLFDDSLWEPALAEMGHALQFWLREKDFIWAFLDYRATDHRGRNPQMDAYAELLAQLHVDGVTTRIVIPPLHARMLLVIDAVGLWPAWEDWKRQLVAVNEAVAEAAGTEPFPLIDCSGFHAYAVEPVPELGDTTSRMRWYFEGSHFQTSLGDRVLDRLYGLGEPPPPGFGRPLSAATIADAIAAVEAERQRFIANRPELVADIRNRARLLVDLKEGRFDPSTLDPAVREQIEAQIRLLQGQ